MECEGLIEWRKISVTLSVTVAIGAFIHSTVRIAYTKERGTVSWRIWKVVVEVVLLKQRLRILKTNVITFARRIS